MLSSPHKVSRSQPCRSNSRNGRKGFAFEGNDSGSGGASEAQKAQRMPRNPNQTNPIDRLEERTGTKVLDERSPRPSISSSTDGWSPVQIAQGN